MKDVEIIKNPESELLKDLHVKMLSIDRRKTFAIFEASFQYNGTVSRRVIKVRCKNEI